MHALYINTNEDQSDFNTVCVEGSYSGAQVDSAPMSQSRPS